MNAVYFCFHPTASGEVSQLLCHRRYFQQISKKAGDFLVFSVKGPHQSLSSFHTPLRRLLELEWICACPFHMLSLKVSLEVLAKTMIHVFCEIPGAISWAWLLSASQSRAGVGRTPSHSRGLLRCRAVRNRRATLICSSWRSALNPKPTL